MMMMMMIMIIIIIIIIIIMHYCQLLEQNYSIIQYMAQPFHKILGTSSQSVILNGKINTDKTVP